MLALVQRGARERSAALRALDEERGVCVERSGMSAFQWEHELLDTRNEMESRAREALRERCDRDADALACFERTMTFALPQRIEALVLGAIFNQVVLRLAAPLRTIVGVVRVAAGLYDDAQAGARRVTLARWIEAHRTANRAARQRAWDFEPAFAPLDSRLRALAADTSDAAEAEKMFLLQQMREEKFAVATTADELEVHLYDEWCRQNGAAWVANVYRTDRDFPGHEELGAHAVGDVTTPQLYYRGVPGRILDRLLRMGLAPAEVLHPATEVHHHVRERDGRWRETHVTHVALGPKWPGEEATR